MQEAVGPSEAAYVVAEPYFVNFLQDAPEITGKALQGIDRPTAVSQ